MRQQYGLPYGKAPVKRTRAMKQMNMRLTLCGRCDIEIIPGQSVLDAELGRVHPFCKRMADADRKAPPKLGRPLNN